MAEEHSSDLKSTTKHKIQASYVIGGRTQTAAGWADEKGINRHTIYKRLARGMSIEEALNSPVREYKENPEFDARPLEIGMQFHNWKVIELLPDNRFVRCECQCIERRTRNVILTNLRQGLSKSCGCWDQEQKTTHGMSRTRTYAAWNCMKDRVAHHTDYIDKGIGICDRWMAFEDFLADMGEMPEDKYSLDRKDNSKGYEPGNCVWATRSEQQRRKTNTRMLTHDNRTQAASAWAEEFGLTLSTLLGRLDRGWTIERALTTPQGMRRGRGTPSTKDKIIEYKGKEQTVAQWAIEFDLHISTMIERLFNDWPMSRIESTPQGIRGGFSRSKEFQRKLKEQEIYNQDGKRVKWMTSEQAGDLLRTALELLSPNQLEKALNVLCGGDDPIVRLEGLANWFRVQDET